MQRTLHTTAFTLFVIMAMFYVFDAAERHKEQQQQPRECVVPAICYMHDSREAV